MYSGAGSERCSLLLLCSSLVFKPRKILSVLAPLSLISDLSVSKVLIVFII